MLTASLMPALRNAPLFIVLAGIGAVSMLVPAVYAWSVADYPVARAFFYSSLLFLFFVWLLGLASSANPPGPEARSKLMTMLGAFTLLPLMLAVPFEQSLRTTSLLSAWWEMVSSFTTTGATLYDPARLPPALHLWRALVGWMGGFFVLVMAISVLAPLRLGGFEIFGVREAGAFAREGRLDGGASEAPYVTGDEAAEPAERMRHSAMTLAPAYAGLTAVLWICLMIAGDKPLIAACLAMSTISTSGILPVSGLSETQAGLWGEGLIFLFFIPALSRRFWPGGGELRVTPRLRDDPELRLAGTLVLGVVAFLFLRHWIAAFEISTPAAFGAVLGSIWGGLFTALSFLTTTGFESASWDEARAWSGLGTPGLILTGLAATGGGIATTAGGVRLLRVYALIRHSQRELDKLLYPDSVAGGGSTARWLRREGAYVAWVFFALFTLTIAAVMLALTLVGVDFEPASVMTVATLSNTGPLAAVAAGHPLAWADLEPAAKAVTAVAMVLGRVETLAIIALFNPEIWRS